MLRVSGSFVLAGLFLNICQPAFADEAADFLEHFSWWEGKWSVEYRLGEDDPRTSETIIERHAPGCHIVKGGGTSLWGYDPHLKTWVGAGFGAEGNHIKWVHERPKMGRITPGTVDKSRSESWEADGTRVIGEETWTYSSDDEATIVRVRETADGKPLPKVVFRCTRLKND